MGIGPSIGGCQGIAGAEVPASKGEQDQMVKRLRTVGGLLALLVIGTAMFAGAPSAVAASSHPFLGVNDGSETTSGEFEFACGVAVDEEGYLYVSSWGTSEVNIFDPAHEFVTSVEDEGGPCDLAVDSEGNIYVHDALADVKLFKPSAYPPTSTTTYTESTIKAQSELSQGIVGIAVNPANDHFYLNTSFAIEEFKSAAEGSGFLNKSEPTGLTGGMRSLDVLGSSGAIYTAIQSSVETDRRIDILNAAGTAVTKSIEAPAGQPFSSLNEAEIAVDQANGDVYVAEALERPDGGVIDQFAADGSFVSRIGPEFSGALRIENAEPANLAVEPEGNVYVGSGIAPGLLFEFGPLLEQFELKVVLEGSGSGVVKGSGIECPTNCSTEVPNGEEVTLTATADSGSEFVGWEGPCSGTGSCAFTMSADTEVHAKFDAVAPPPQLQTLTVSRAGAGAGTVTSSPGGIDCGTACSAQFALNQQVTLTAAAAAGSSFAGWSGACSGAATCTVSMDAAKAVTASFEPKPIETFPPSPGELVITSKATVKGGAAQLKATCAGAGPCSGTVKLTAKVTTGSGKKKKTKKAVIGSSAFSLGAAGSTTLKVKLSGPAKSAIGKGKTLKASLSGTGVKAGSVTLKAAGGK